MAEDREAGHLELREGWAVQSSAEVDQDGAAPSQIGFTPEGWHPAAVPATVVGELDLAGPLVAALRAGELSAEQLLLFFDDNATLLRKNIQQAAARHEESDLERLVEVLFPQYGEAGARIIDNHERFLAVKDEVARRIHEAYGDAIPRVTLVPTLGLFSAGGWADTIDGAHYVFVALERFSDEDLAMELLLAHEIVHGISETDWSKIRGGFDDEGHACFVSAALYPGRPEEAYFLDMDPDRYDRYLAWIDQNRERILADSQKPFVVLDDVHKVYFTTSFSEVPNIAYVIGFKYTEFLSERYSPDALRTFGSDDAANRKEFRLFIRKHPIRRWAPAVP